MGPGSILSVVMTLFMLVMAFTALYFILSGNQENEPYSDEEKGTPVARPKRTVAKQTSPASITVSQNTGGEDQFAGIPEALETHQALIERGGLDRIGDFALEQMPGYFIRAFTHPERNLVAILYRDPGKNVWLNLQTEYKDGRIITTSTLEKPIDAGPRPRGMPIFFYPHTPAEQLMRRHKLEIRGIELAPPLPHEEFPEKFIANYRRLRDVAADERMDEFADSSTWAEDNFEFEKDYPAPPPGQEATQDGGSGGERELAPTQEQILRWLGLIYSRIKIPQEQRDRFKRGLVWIDEKASREAIIRTVNEYSDVTVEDVEGERLKIRSRSGSEDFVDVDGLTGTALFERINSHLPEGSRFTRLPKIVDGVSFFSKMSPNY